MIYQPPIYNALVEYAMNTKSRFHMPGHGGKGDMGFLSEVSKYDVTELSETDNLSCPESVILEAERLASQKFSSGFTLFSCGGATLCIQSALYAALKLRPVSEKSRLYCHRRVHKSVINAFFLLGVDPVWVDSIEKADTADCGIFVYTHTDYYGSISDTETVKKLGEKGIITVADNSHGSHLAFMDDGRLHPVRIGVNFAVDSLHKTLPVLTGGACLHVKEAEHAHICREGMALFGSTSPNYLIMASIDRAVSQADGEVFKRTAEAVKKLKKRHPQYFSYIPDGESDPLRIVLRCENPCELYEMLYKSSVKCEFYDGSGVVLLPPYGTTDKDFELLEGVLSEYDPGVFIPQNIPNYPIPLRKTDIRSAMLSKSTSVPIEKSEGKISASEYSLYPPGIPLIVPGEVFDKSIICRLKGSFDTVDILN